MHPATNTVTRSVMPGRTLFLDYTSTLAATAERYLACRSARGCYRVVGALWCRDSETDKAFLFSIATGYRWADLRI
jgi:hypothetical protein